MCTMAIPKGACRKRPVRIVRDRTLDGLPDFIRRQCATHDGARAYLASVGLQRTRDGRLTRELLALFRDSKIPVVLLGGEVPPTGFPCDSVGVNYLAHGRRTRVNLSSPTARHDFNLLSHGELFGDVAIRLMLQRLQYGPKHPPAEVYLDLPKPNQHNNKPTRKGTKP